MAQGRLRTVGRLSLDEFHGNCLMMVRETAAGIQRNLAAGGVRVEGKTSYAGVPDADVVTSIDRAAQQELTRLAARYMPPQIGHIGEEDNLRRASRFSGYSLVLTFDPADGTRKLVEAIRARRRLVPGEVSVMLGVQLDGVAVAGYICDVASLVTYARRMYTTQLVRVETSGNSISTSSLPRARRFSSATLLRHGDRPFSSPLTQRIANASGSVVQGKDSIGLSVVRIFTGEFGGMLRLAGMHVTPWDDTPVQAMCTQGDVVMLRIGRNSLEEVSFSPLDQVTRQDYDVLYVHRLHLDELRRIAPVVTRG
jgi:fructose-1,6-bisphosphatase/inositol monophosphatase family enzyme